MQMLCTRNEDIIVAVFFDVKTCVTTSTENQGSVREFLNQASLCFTYSGLYLFVFYMTVVLCVTHLLNTGVVLTSHFVLAQIVT